VRGLESACATEVRGDHNTREIFEGNVVVSVDLSIPARPVSLFLDAM
jgi:hypothetical protein